MKTYRSMKKGLRREYIDLVQFFHTEAPTMYMSGIRKYVEDLRWIVNDFFDDPLDMKMLGYNERAKMNQLNKVYVSVPKLEEAGRRVRQEMDNGRDVFSVVFPLMGDENKPERMKSFCMVACIAMRTKNVSQLMFYYRTTEVVKKFGADLFLLKGLMSKFLPPDFIKEVERVIFQFALAYAGSNFYPLAYTWGCRVPEDNDERFMRTCRQQMGKALELDYRPGYSQTAKAFHTFREWHFGPGFGKTALLLKKEK